MTTARQAIQEILDHYTSHGHQRPALICQVSGGKVRVASQAGEDARDLPAALRSAGGFPTLAVLLHLHSKVLDNPMPSIELRQDEGKASDTSCYFAVCGYPPTRSDYGMAYRNAMRFVIHMTLDGDSHCNRVAQNGVPEERELLIQRAEKAGRAILDFDWTGGAGKAGYVDFDDLVDHDWFDRFLSPQRLPVKLTKEEESYLGEDLTSDLQSRFGSLTEHGNWRPHTRAKRDSITWWVLVSLYTSFAWASQFPAYRSADYTARRQHPKKKGVKLRTDENPEGLYPGRDEIQSTVEIEKDRDLAYGEFLDGLNVSGLLLSPQLKPLAWSFNSNRVNKTLHAETALVLAWLKGHRDETEFEGYTFLSPWRSCCMCSGWISDVYRNSETIWFIDDPGLPVRHLDWGANHATEIFLPKLLEVNARKTDKRFGDILEACTWFQMMGRATYLNYNDGYDEDEELNDYRSYLKSLARKDKTTGEMEPELKGPTDLFASLKYFKQLQKAWNMTRKLPTSVMDLLDEAGELEAYVNNIWALRRCVLTFDPPK